jgi:hypothetical protein
VVKMYNYILRNNPHHFWKYVYNFKRKDNSFIQLKIEKQYVTDPKIIADAFAKHFASTFSSVVWNSITSTVSVKLERIQKNLQRYVMPDSLTMLVHLLVDMRTF